MNLYELNNLSDNQARQYIEGIFWPNGAICPHCGIQGNSTKLSGKSCRPGLYQCKDCSRQFTVTVGTVLEGTKIKLKKWLLAFHLMCSNKKGISALQLSHELGITHKSAWFMCSRIREAMQIKEPSPLEGVIEADETYVGGRSKKGTRGRGSERKFPVAICIQRGGPVVAKVIKRADRKTLRSFITKNVHRTSTIVTDEWLSYRGIGDLFSGGHLVVNHGRKEWVKGKAYTNTAESYFALLKRTYHGTFHWFSRKHVNRYLAEISFRWNNRKLTIGEKRTAVIRQSKAKRLKYRQLVG